jgi:hypothetical protein
MSTTPFNPFDFMNTPWGKLPMGNNGIPGTDINELEKRITELKTVEQWLNMNLSLLRTTIQGLEVQRGTLAAIAAFSKSYAPTENKSQAQKTDSARTAGPGATGEPPPAGLEQAAWWWNSMQEQFGQMLTAAQASAQSMVTPDPASNATSQQGGAAGESGANRSEKNSGLKPPGPAGGANP